MIIERMAVARRGSQGFVLVGVIWFLACMTLVVTAAMLWIDRSRDGLVAQQTLLQRCFEERTLLSRLTWLIATHRMTVAGQTTAESLAAQVGEMDPSILPAGAEIPVDGREYCLANGACITLIDRASRISLTSSEPAAISSLLVSLGVPVEDVPRMLVDLAAYLRDGSTQTVSARHLRSVMEVFVLASWRPWESRLVTSGWNDRVAIDEAALNLNTAGSDVLLRAWRLSPGGVSRLLMARQEHPIIQRVDVDELLGTEAESLPQEGWSRLPSSVLMIRMRFRSSVIRYEYEVSFESTDMRLPPWQFLQRRTLSIDAPESNAATQIHTTPGVLAAPLVAGPWG
ncbi:hypothetical protein NK553_12480 [Pseudomonas sp. ZM23]|uniref:General secretion pathway protein GspK n=1 Tax=Pseudomonas triclosanedens TaxID=2961893 RepID=A0ABY7A2V1_9PSED|nr:hypothetical protein [Pseudomonas triclosanedens]MCP8464765.1 hypothetical protein [Pseudomonas triclosanedens]MCP8470522.1 hypothetical protein [Pseudomonas triclosanedens]MCP8476328.1 hypothetical protein [Pseudomonas triclosanedens]WAI51443.1 hypothetical protein OU419_09400 [Pseudomonas triclosanedens]